MSANDYFSYQQRLQAIEQELADKQPDYERYADDAVRMEKQYELRVARGKVVSKAVTETAKKDQVLVSIAAADDGFYEKYVETLATYAGIKAAVKLGETRAMIGMALLKAQQRETGG